MEAGCKVELMPEMGHVIPLGRPSASSSCPRSRGTLHVRSHAALTTDSAHRRRRQRRHTARRRMGTHGNAPCGAAMQAFLATRRGGTDRASTTQELPSHRHRLLCLSSNATWTCLMSSACCSSTVKPPGQNSSALLSSRRSACGYTTRTKAIGAGRGMARNGRVSL